MSDLEKAGMRFDDTATHVLKFTDERGNISIIEGMAVTGIDEDIPADLAVGVMAIALSYGLTPVPSVEDGSHMLPVGLISGMPVFLSSHLLFGQFAISLIAGPDYDLMINLPENVAALSGHVAEHVLH